MFAVTTAVLHAPGSREPMALEEPICTSVSAITASVERKIHTGALPGESPWLQTVTVTWTALFGSADGGATTDCTQRSGPPSVDRCVESASAAGSEELGEHASARTAAST